LTSKVGDIGVTMTKAIPVNDFVEPAGTRKIAERRAWATVAVIGKCAVDLINSCAAPGQCKLYLDPLALKNAVAEAAYREIISPGSLAPDLERGAAIQSIQAGSVEIV
jgi:hypothetical protein